MTVSSTTSRSANQTANGANRTWPFVFRYGSVTDLVLDVTDLAGLVTIVTSGFNITPNADFSGGSIEYPISPAAFLASGYKVRVRRVTPRKQSASMGNQGAFLPANYEAALDALEMQLQEAEENFTDVQSIYAGAGNVPAPLVGQVGQVLTATSTGVFGWAALPAASIGTSQLIAKAVTLAKLADFTGPKKILGSIQGSAVAAEISLGVSLDIASGLLNVQPRLITVYTTSSGSHVPQSWTRRMRVRGWGAGGAGGGVTNVSASEGAGGNGGGGGSYVEHEYTSIAGSYAWAVGAAGVAVSAASGGTGGSTTFGALTAAGGVGGQVGTSAGSLGPQSNATASGVGGAASGGNIANASGGPGSWGMRGTGVAFSGFGGAGAAGGGGATFISTPSGGSSTSGIAGTAPGGGGGGAANNNLTAGGTRPGGNGGAGLIIVEEYAA